MSRDGGGWTLLVTSHTNTWTADDVTLRNPDKPSLTADFSILKYADDIKNHLNVIGGKFEYRLEAQRPGLYYFMFGMLNYIMKRFCPGMTCFQVCVL